MDKLQKWRVDIPGSDLLPGYDDMLLLDHATRRHLFVFSVQSCTLSPPISYRACEESPFEDRRCVGRAISCDDNEWLIF